MYEKGNVSIREEKKIPRMFHSRSHFGLLNSTAQVKKKDDFASKIKLNKYQQNKIDKSSDREAA